MIFTSEDLLKAMGLKEGDNVGFVGVNNIFTITKNDGVYFPSGFCLYCEDKDFSISITTLLDFQYSIIQPKPTLTEDEKVILRNLPKEYKWIVRDSYQKGGNVYLFKDKPKRSFVIIGGDGYWTDDRNHFSTTSLIAFNHLFQSIKWEDEPYSIEELLKE